MNKPKNEVTNLEEKAECLNRLLNERWLCTEAKKGYIFANSTYPGIRLIVHKSLATSSILGPLSQLVELHYPPDEDFSIPEYAFMLDENIRISLIGDLLDCKWTLDKNTEVLKRNGLTLELDFDRGIFFVDGSVEEIVDFIFNSKYW